MAGSSAAEPRTVDVCGAELLVDDFGKEYAAYVCQIVPKSSTTPAWHVLRRYSDWETLRAALPRADAAQLSEFPAKLFYGSKTPKVLEARRLALQTWITALMRTPSLCNSEVVLRWLRPTQEDVDYDREYGHSYQLSHPGSEPLAETQVSSAESSSQAQASSRTPTSMPSSTPTLHISAQPQLSQPDSEPFVETQESSAESQPASLACPSAPSPTLTLHTSAPADLQMAPEAESVANIGQGTDPSHSSFKSAGHIAAATARMRADSALTDGEAAIIPACPGRYEYVVAFAPGDDGLSVSNDVRKLLSEHELSVESVSTTHKESTSAQSHFLLITTSTNQLDQQAERDGAYKWTKHNDSITGKPHKKLFTRSRCTEFAGQYRNGELRHEYGTPDFFCAAERAHMVRSIMDDLRAKDDACSTLLARVAKMKDYGHITSPQLEHESLIDALSRAGTESKTLCIFHVKRWVCPASSRRYFEV